LTRTGLFYKKDYKEVGWPVPPSPEIYGETQLFRKILDYALIDYLGNCPELRQDAEEWLCLDDPDFIETCECADIDPEIVFKVFVMFRPAIKRKPT
tara:strand:- start:498 stop:785 length:288 start_codon:yes stop_codon:yes gene_type:complete